MIIFRRHQTPGRREVDPLKVEAGREVAPLKTLCEDCCTVTQHAFQNVFMVPQIVRVVVCFCSEHAEVMLLSSAVDGFEAFPFLQVSVRTHLEGQYDTPLFPVRGAPPTALAAPSRTSSWFWTKVHEVWWGLGLV